MKMMKRIFILLSIAAVLFTIAYMAVQKEETGLPPRPIDRMSVDEKNTFRQQRDAWMEEMHRSAPDEDWRLAEKENRLSKRQAVLAKRKELSHRGKLSRTNEDLIPGVLEGTWKELGSNNQAGRILTVDVDYQNNTIYAASEGGNIWKGNIDGSNWTSLNDYFQIDHIGFLKRFQAGANMRLIAVDQSPYVYYSDDEGATWETASGLENPQNWGSIRKTVMRADMLNTMYLVTSEWDYVDWVGLSSLYTSVDNGESFQLVQSFIEGAGQFDLWTSKIDESPVVMAKSDTIFFVHESGALEQRSVIDPTIPSSIGKVYLGGHSSATEFVVYAAFNEGDQTSFYVSSDSCLTWNYKGVVATGGFSPNSFHVSLSNSQELSFGGVNVFKSANGGISWNLVNEWWEYYDYPATKLHADIPEIESFITPSGNEQYFISTDGGIYESSDFLQNTANISLQGLRVSQYYSVLSNNDYPYLIYGGSQDQGFQASAVSSGDFIDFEQTISGDYGHLVSGDKGYSIWTVYPGFIMYYPQISINYESASQDFNGTNYLWMPPLCAHPSSATSVWLGGGGSNGGAHLWKYSYVGTNVNGVEYPYDFESESGEKISAIGFSQLNSQMMYVSTSKGAFYYSINQGTTWNQTQNFDAPDGHYFYGNSIKSSPIDTNTVYVAGSGYSNPAVYKSEDHGQSFVSMDQNLPATLVYELAINDDNSMIFAACEAGPFVYIDSLNSWFPLHGVSAPDQVYWSVEYISSINAVRFGTHGRGIWELALNEVVNTIHESKELEVKVYPNPFSNQVSIELTSLNGNHTLQLFDVAGKLVFKSANTLGTKFIWDGKDHYGNELKPGTYFYHISGEKANTSGSLIKL